VFVYFHFSLLFLHLCIIIAVNIITILLFLLETLAMAEKDVRRATDSGSGASERARKLQAKADAQVARLADLTVGLREQKRWDTESTNNNLIDKNNARLFV
jgi:hypothetical protein